MEARLDALRGESPEMVAVRRQVAQLLARQTAKRPLPPILILGETGAGKGLLAHTIHQAGPRRQQPFIDVNCAAIPETLLEAELFGYERGAFTDARQAKAGLFQTAHGGTLFLDEIGLLPSAVQGKLLSALEDRAVRRLGSTRAEVVDVVLVAATSVDLQRAVAEGRFRADLYHRLAVISLEMPPLRERRADILPLAEHFLARVCADYGLARRTLTPDARDLLRSYRWPGNVRELANAMERATLLSDTDAITAGMLDFLVSDAVPTTRVVHVGAGGETAASAGSLDDALRARIETALGERAWNIRQTAEALGISRNTLRARMDKYGLRRHAAPERSRAKPAPATAAPVTAPVPPVQWERRHLAFLRARLLSTSTVERVRALEIVAEKVRSFGGRLEESSPTGLIAVFGLEPVDNAPSHAALAALAIQNALVAALGADREPPALVLGIHCADHVVGRQAPAPRIGIDGKAATWSALETLVADDVSAAIFVSDAVAPFLSRRFVIERIHGLGRLVLRRRDDATALSVTRFVGRAMELDQIGRALERTLEGHGQVVAIVGEAGVGKSRLVREATLARAADGWLILHTGAVAYGDTTPYMSVIELLKSYFKIEDRDDPQDVREKVRGRLLGLDRGLEFAHPALLSLLDVPVVDAHWQALDPAQRRELMLDSVRRLLLRESEAQPVLVVFEDLHWLDGETQALLDRLVDSLPSARLMLLVNYRSEYRHRWGVKTYYRQVSIAPLPPGSAEDLLRQLVGDDPALASLKRLLLDRTEGNPFFLEECVRTMVEAGVLAGERGAHRLGVAPPTVEVPATVRGVLAARIDRLPPQEKLLVQAAAVIGTDMPFALLRSIADLPDDDLRRYLSHLQAGEFVYEARLFPDPEYTFKHALTHEVALGSLLPDDQRALHARIVDAIERLHAGRIVEHVERLVRHALGGELWDKAVRYSRDAAAKALARSANREAVTWFEHALRALRHVPPSEDRRKQAIDLHLYAASPLFALGKVEPILEHLREVEGLAQASDDPTALGRTYSYMSECLWLTAKPARALEYGRRGLGIAAVRENLPVQAGLRFVMGHAYHGLGQYRLAAAEFEWHVSSLTGDLLYRRMGFTGLPSVLARAWLASALAELGEFADALRRAEEAVQVADAAAHPFSLVAAYWSLGSARLRQGEHDLAIADLEKALQLAERWEIPLWLIWIAPALGAGYLQANAVGRALPLLETALEQVKAMGVMTYYSLLLAHLGEACLVSGRLSEADTLAQQALEWTRQHGERGTEAYTLRLLGDVGLRGDPVDAAATLDHYSQAMAAAEELGMRPLLAHCHAGLAKLYGHVGRSRDSGVHLVTARGMYRDLGMTRWSENVE